MLLLAQNLLFRSQNFLASRIRKVLLIRNPFLTQTKIVVIIVRPPYSRWCGQTRCIIVHLGQHYGPRQFNTPERYSNLIHRFVKKILQVQVILIVSCLSRTVLLNWFHFKYNYPYTKAPSGSASSLDTSSYKQCCVKCYRRNSIYEQIKCRCPPEINNLRFNFSRSFISSHVNYSHDDWLMFHLYFMLYGRLVETLLSCLTSWSPETSFCVTTSSWILSRKLRKPISLLQAQLT